MHRDAMLDVLFEKNMLLYESHYYIKTIQQLGKEKQFSDTNIMRNGCQRNGWFGNN